MGLRPWAAELRGLGGGCCPVRGWDVPGPAAEAAGARAGQQCPPGLAGPPLCRAYLWLRGHGDRQPGLLLREIQELVIRLGVIKTQR